MLVLRYDRSKYKLINWEKNLFHAINLNQPFCDHQREHKAI